VAAHDAVFFDFDGVLAESSDIKTHAFYEMYKEYGSDIAERVVAHHTINAGVSRRKKIRHYHREFLGIAITEEDVAALIQRFSEIVEDAVVGADWVPGAREFLDAHVGEVMMFVLSGTPQGELERINARRGMTHYFVSIHGSPPEKEATIVELLRRHGLDRDRVLFVGDAFSDYRAARSTGLGFVGRVPPGGDNRFPEGTDIIPDLTQLKV
jgi:phosphoglycolate phosphatase-like HAD superfamily hydrolase